MNELMGKYAISQFKAQRPTTYFSLLNSRKHNFINSDHYVAKLISHDLTIHQYDKKVIFLLLQFNTLAKKQTNKKNSVREKGFYRVGG